MTKEPRAQPPRASPSLKVDTAQLSMMSKRTTMPYALILSSTEQLKIPRENYKSRLQQLKPSKFAAGFSWLRP